MRDGEGNPTNVIECSRCRWVSPRNSVSPSVGAVVASFAWPGCHADVVGICGSENSIRSGILNRHRIRSVNLVQCNTTARSCQIATSAPKAGESSPALGFTAEAIRKMEPCQANEDDTHRESDPKRSITMRGNDAVQANQAGFVV